MLFCETSADSNATSFSLYRPLSASQPEESEPSPKRPREDLNAPDIPLPPEPVQPTPPSPPQNLLFDIEDIDDLVDQLLLQTEVRIPISDSPDIPDSPDPTPYNPEAIQPLLQEFDLFFPDGLPPEPSPDSYISHNTSFPLNPPTQEEIKILLKAYLQFKHHHSVSSVEDDLTHFPLFLDGQHVKYATLQRVVEK